MKIRKRIIAIICALALILSALTMLCACGFGYPPNQPSQGTGVSGSSSDSGTAEPPAPGTLFLLSQKSVVELPSFALYAVFREYASQSVIVPGLDEHLVPQGMDIWDEEGLLIISGYFSKTTKIDSSVLVAIDLESGKLVGEYYLMNADGSANTSHVGGVAITESNLFISNAQKLHRIPLESIKATGGQGDVQIVESISVPTNASFCNYSAGILWVGDFAHGTDYQTDEYRHMTGRDGNEYSAWAVGYRLSDTASEISDKALSGKDFATPDLILSIPDRIQGFCVVSEKHIALSQSYGRTKNSGILLYDNILDETAHASVNLNGESVPLWFLDSVTGSKQIIAPPMSEGICELGGKLYILFESGADKYRNDGGKYPTDRVWVMNMP